MPGRNEPRIRRLLGEIVVFQDEIDRIRIFETGGANVRIAEPPGVEGVGAHGYRRDDGQVEAERATGRRRKQWPRRWPRSGEGWRRPPAATRNHSRVA